MIKNECSNVEGDRPTWIEGIFSFCSTITTTECVNLASLLINSIQFDIQHALNRLSAQPEYCVFGEAALVWQILCERHFASQRRCQQASADRVWRRNLPRQDGRVCGVRGGGKKEDTRGKAKQKSFFPLIFFLFFACKKNLFILV